MIKTFVKQDSMELDKSVNDFKAQRRQNLPVRTESYVLTDGTGFMVHHKATVFYDERFEIITTKPTQSFEGVKIEEEYIEDSKQDKREFPENLGALWDRNEKGISGKFKGESIKLPESASIKLREERAIKVTIKGIRTIITATKKKTTDKSPDYYINEAQ